MPAERDAKDTEKREAAGDLVKAREQAKRDELEAILRRRFIVAGGPAEEWETKKADVIAEHHRQAVVEAESPDDHAGERTAIGTPSDDAERTTSF